MSNQVMMSQFLKLGTTIATLLGTIAIASPSAQAGTFSPPRWTQTFDSVTDGVDGNLVGGNSSYEMRSIAIGQDNDRLYFLLDGNMPLAGVSAPNAEDGNISYGDLFLHFNPLQRFNEASASASLFGIRFAPNNNSGVPEIGVYRGVTAMSVTATNSGFSSLSAYNEAVKNLGGTPSFGGFEATTPYFDQTSSILNVIGSGTKIGGINFLSSEDLDRLNAPQTANRAQDIAFSVEKDLFPIDDFIAYISELCGNDSMAAQGEVQSVPEPSSILGLATVGLMLAGKRLRKRLVG